MAAIDDPKPKPVTVSSKQRGLGDTIASITKAVGIKPCGGCKKRQEWLNDKHEKLRELMKPKTHQPPRHQGHQEKHKNKGFGV